MSVDRWDLERAVLASDLPAPARLVVLVLISRADWPGGTIPAEHTPSLTRLAALTALARSTVAATLNAVEASGWVIRNRPTVAAARSTRARTQYRIVHPRLVQDTDQSPSPTAGPVREPDQHWSGSRTTTSPGAGHKPDRSQTAPSSSATSPAPGPVRTGRRDQAADAARLVAEQTDASPDEAAAVVDLWTRERHLRAPAAFLRGIPPHEIQDRVDQLRADAHRAGRRAFLDSVADAPPCHHGYPGGHITDPSGWVVCPIHRAHRRTA